jgi:tripartite-type tricarboxylate transporter receptor subunit TctC
VPDLPTSAEAGLPGMELQVFNGLFVRSGTAAPMISKYSAAAEQVKQNLDFRDGLDKSGFEDAPAGNAAEAQRTVDREMVRLSRLVKDINFRAG